MSAPRTAVIVAVCALSIGPIGIRRPLPAAEPGGLSGSVEPDVQDILFLGPTRPVLIRLRVTNNGRPFRELWDERFSDAFSSEDRDGDGQLDFSQASAVTREMNGGLAETTSSDLKAAVASGTIDRATLQAYVETALPRFTLRPRAVIGQGAALALFPLLDADRDQQLTAGELVAAEQQLRQRDFDDNGVITPGELILDPKAIAAAADPESAERDLDASQAPVVAIRAETTAAQLAERLLAHYDRDGDGRLKCDGPATEIDLPIRLLRRWDTDDDGSLTREELAELTLWQPELELKFAFGQSSARRTRSRRRPRSGAGFRVRRKLLGGYELKLGEAEIDFDRNNRDPRQADLVRMSQYDRDDNEYIDADEAAANNIGPSAFAAMDVDGDGKVFKGELTSFMDRQNEAAAARLHLIIRDLGRDLFGLLDLDMDGLLSARELRDARSVLDLEDKNGDGVLHVGEITARLELELVRGVDERTDADARLIRRAVRGTDQAETAGPLWFRKMDRNNDGDLSPREFVGPRQAFDRLDSDGDGLIDRSEAEAAAS